MLAHRRLHARSPCALASPVPVAWRTHRGLTLIELLVCVVILSLLAAILLPGVMSVRSSSWRMQCVNNLFQIGQALNNYHDAHRTFPPGYVARVGVRGEDLSAGWGWAVMLLPMLDQRSLYDRMSVRATHDDDSSPKAPLRLDVFLCPADAAASSYVASFGQGDMWLNPDQGDGVFFRNSRIRSRDIEDGPMTIMVGERSSDLGTVAWPGVYSVTDSTMPVATDHSRVVDRTLVLGHTGMLVGNDLVHAPNTVPPCLAGFGSMHTNGSNFLMADCSVRFLTSQINPAVYVALATRAGGELVNLTDF